jgi:ABC-2 type transport system ATP-binding protein
MHAEQPAIEVRGLVRKFKRTDAVDGLNLRVTPGRCYGFFGRNGAGKTTTIKCLLNLIRPTAGEVRVFGLDPVRAEVEIKSRLTYVPDFVAFYPWMTVRQALDYCAAFRSRWNVDTERALLDQFRLDQRQKTTHLSKGQRTQLALITAICPEPELLVLDEPTSGLDPIVRREFIRTVIGAYQEVGPGRRTVFVSTHLISEFEGLIDEFTIIDRGRKCSPSTPTRRASAIRRSTHVSARRCPTSRCRACDPCGATAGKSKSSRPATRERSSISCARVRRRTCAAKR